MAEGGYDRLPLWSNEEIPDPADNDDEDETSPFVPNGASTPAPEFQTQQGEEEDGFSEITKQAEALGFKSSSLSPILQTAEAEILKEFPNADKNRIKYMMDDKGRAQVGLMSPKKPYYRLLTQVAGKSGEYRINPKLPLEVLRALGQSRRETIETEIQRLSEGIIENKKIAEDTAEDQTEIRKARQKRAQMQISRRIDLQRELDYLKAGEYTRDGGGQSIPLEVFKKNEEKWQKREEQLLKEKQEQEKIINDENVPISEKEKAEKEIEYNNYNNNLLLIERYLQLQINSALHLMSLNIKV